MNNINSIAKRFYVEIIAWAEQIGDEELERLKKEYSSDLAENFFICDFVERYPLEVLDWVQRNRFFRNDEQEDEKEEKLAHLIENKIIRDSDKIFKQNNAFDCLINILSGYTNPRFN